MTTNDTDITRSGTCKVGVHKACAMSNCQCECHVTEEKPFGNNIKDFAKDDEVKKCCEKCWKYLPMRNVGGACYDFDCDCHTEVKPSWPVCPECFFEIDPAHPYHQSDCSKAVKINLLSDKLVCAGCGDCLADPTVLNGEQCVKHRSCSCHYLAESSDLKDTATTLSNVNTSDELVEEVVREFNDTFCFDESLGMDTNSTTRSCSGDKETLDWLRSTLTSLIARVGEEENRVPTGDNFAQEIVSRWKQEGRMEALDEVEKDITAMQRVGGPSKDRLKRNTLIGEVLSTIADLKKK